MYGMLHIDVQGGSWADLEGPLAPVFASTSNMHNANAHGCWLLVADRESK
jgi:hypothetical protein